MQKPRGSWSARLVEQLVALCRLVDWLDRRITRWMARFGHTAERVGLAIVFIWFGALKLVGQHSATSIIAKTVYLGPPHTTVPILGLWEVAIGVCLLVRPLFRVAILLMIVRLPGTLLALFIKWEECFHESVFTPTVQGQYLIKDAALFGAALIIGSTARMRHRARQQRL